MKPIPVSEKQRAAAMAALAFLLSSEFSSAQKAAVLKDAIAAFPQREDTHVVRPHTSLHAELYLAATAFLSAFGGNIPDWLRAEADQLSSVLAKHASSTAGALPPDLAGALRDLVENVKHDLHGYWTESTANMVQQADATLQRYTAANSPSLLDACEMAEHWLTEESASSTPGSTRPAMILDVLRNAIEAARRRMAA